MKKMLYIPLMAALALGFMSCNESKENSDGSLPTDLIHNPQSAEGEVDMENLPIMTFEKDLHDFGEIVQGEKVTYEFKFTNTGKSDLLITSARASCGCTVPDYPKEPIAPGLVSYIKVQYNSEGRKDAFNKTVTITANTIPNENKIRIKGVVIVPQN
ncbi:MAG: DUF1573 domain-containing protein [Chitinophagales bacterium]|nr:DUF1573 domain-containing protein [Chitinophagales bacterium]